MSNPIVPPFLSPELLATIEEAAIIFARFNEELRPTIEAMQARAAELGELYSIDAATIERFAAFAAALNEPPRIYLPEFGRRP